MRKISFIALLLQCMQVRHGLIIIFLIFVRELSFIVALRTNEAWFNTIDNLKCLQLRPDIGRYFSLCLPTISPTSCDNYYFVNNYLP